MSKQKAISEAIEICTLRGLASAIGVSYQAVQKYEATQIPSEKVIPIAIATGWKVTPHRQRPDIYPHPDDGLPPEMRCECAKVAA